jgi:RNA polymerase sigma-70 factor (ECF subfamily)
VVEEAELEQALEAARQGDEWGLVTLYRWAQPGLVRYLASRAGEDAEDLASEVWIEASRRLADFKGGAHDFRRFLFAVAHRRSIDRLRRRGRRRTEPAPNETLDVASTVGSPEEAVLGRLDSEDAVRLIVTLLPEEQAEVVLLRVVAGLSVPEVAEIVGRRPAAVSVIQHRALKRLAQKLQDSPVLQRSRE